MCAPLSKLYPFNHLNLSLKHCSVNMQMDKADSIIAVTFKTFSPLNSCLQMMLLFLF